LGLPQEGDRRPGRPLQGRAEGPAEAGARPGGAAPGRGRRGLSRLAAAFAWAMLALLAAAGAARAHDARPLSVELTQRGEGVYLARLRVPPTVAADDQPKIIWPAGCKVLSDQSEDGPVAPGETILVTCKGGLPGKALQVRYPIYNPSLATLFRLAQPGGKTITRVLPPDQPSWTVP